MCTVTFLPCGNNDYILTSNRDEKNVRKKAQPPRKFIHGSFSVFYPKDPEAGGTWIVTGKKHFTLCLLNGAFEKHRSAPPYRKSRGLVVLDFFEFDHVNAFARLYDFTGIEPFTLVILDTTTTLQLHELRWDGQTITLTPKDADTPHIWSSVTLYEKEVIAQRREWFSNWLQENREYRMEEIIRFHEFGGTGDKTNDLLMNRGNEVLTVSITSIAKLQGNMRMHYRDIPNDTAYAIQIL